METVTVSQALNTGRNNKALRSADTKLMDEMFQLDQTGWMDQGTR